MALFTSRFKSAVPCAALKLMGVALAAWAAGAFYTIRLDPEVTFNRYSHQQKQAWVAKLETNYPCKTVIFGGSSCRTSVDAERMLKLHGIPLANLGLSAGIGTKVLTGYALHSLRPGDTLLVAMEPILLTRPCQVEASGVHFAFAVGNPALLRDPTHVNWPSALLDLRPGAYHLFTLFGKVILRLPLYRYSIADLHPGGWQEVRERRDFPNESIGTSNPLSDDGKACLGMIRDFCAERKVRVAYVLPWCYCPTNQADVVRKESLGFISQISDFMPVLKDPVLGAYPAREQYADTVLHLTGEGAAERTDFLAQQIQKWEVWTPEELGQARTFSPRPGIAIAH